MSKEKDKSVISAESEIKQINEIINQIEEENKNINEYVQDIIVK